MSGEIVHIEFPAADADRATRFWEGLFGWKFARLGDARDGLPDGPDERVERRGHLPVRRAPGHPNFYFATDDINASIAKVRELGGEAGERSPVPGHGWFASCSDSESNAFHLWQQDESAG